MKNVELTGTKRQANGTSSAKGVRRNKQVPCVLYGGTETLHFSVDEAALEKIVHSPDAHRVELDIDGEKHVAILQAKQFQPVTDRVIHADFLRAEPGKATRMNMTVRLKGQSTGVRKGGKLSHTMRRMRIKGELDVLPNVIELDISGLDVGETIRVKDIQLPGITLLEKPNDVVVAIKAPKKAAEAAAAAPAADKKAEPAKK